MWRRHAYYAVKPLIPLRLRRLLRRRIARRTLAASSEVWPILESAGTPPPGWPGWPDRRQFAFVLSHDVEGPEGVAKVRALAELEMSFGFRSAFNFIPEGDYTVPDDLRHWLTENGFEVGVHDLSHDGWLFASAQGFPEKAARLNRHLRAWSAEGFRGGFMLRNLDWLHQLDITYDSSTFDTDPFEPQPDGAGTIFPFWIPAPETGADGLPRGYVELPYTLVQDSTLFLLLRERTPEIWQRKLDWIAAKGGMALLNTHPDYKHFGPGHDPLCFHADLYAGFLKHVATRHKDSFWHALPRDVARWYRQEARECIALASGAPAGVEPMPGKRVAVLLFSHYPFDPRPRRAAEAMVAAGMQVDLICLQEHHDEPLRETIGGVNVRRLKIHKTRGGKLAYFAQYGRFIAACFAILAGRCLTRRYDLVHVHNMPDVLVFSALPARLLGARLILDLHDPMPELMRSIYSLPPDHRLIGMLKRLERWSTRFADHVITVNQACVRIFSQRSCPEEKIAVVMNAPEERIFGRQPVEPVPPRPDRLVIMYHGSIVERHGLDLAVHALAAIRPTCPEAELHVYGPANAFFKEVMVLAATLAVTDAIHHHPTTDQEGIARAIDGCDVGIVPNRRSIFTEINTPTRIFEYLARGKLVIAPDSPGITDYFRPDQLVFFRLGDAEDLAHQLARVAQRGEDLADLIRRGQSVYEKHRWSRERQRLLRVAHGLLNPTGTSARHFVPERP